MYLYQYLTSKVLIHCVHNRNIQAMLQQEMETSSLLRAEMEEMKQTFTAKHEKEQAKYQTLQK